MIHDSMERNNSSAWSVARASHDQETWSTIWGSMQERNHSSAQFVRGTFPHCIVWLKIAPPIIHQRIQKGKRQTPFKCTKCTPESVNVNILLGAVQKWCHLPRGEGSAKKWCGKGSRQKVTKVKHYYILGERGVSKFFRKSGGGVILNSKWYHFWTTPYFVHVRRTGVFSL